MTKPDFDSEAVRSVFDEAKAGCPVASGLRALWFAYYVDGGRVDPEKSVNGGDVVDLLGELFAAMQMAPPAESSVDDLLGPGALDA